MGAYLLIGIVISIAILLLQNTPTTTKSMINFMITMCVTWPVYLPVFIYEGLKQIELLDKKVDWYVLKLYMAFSITLLVFSFHICALVLSVSIIKGCICLLVFSFMLFVHSITFSKIYQTYKREKNG